MPNPNPPATSKAENAVSTIVQVAGILVPEAGPALQLFGLLEPVLQQGFAALITKAHAKKLTAQDYLDQAQQLINARNTAK